MSLMSVKEALDAARKNEKVFVVVEDGGTVLFEGCQVPKEVRMGKGNRRCQGVEINVGHDNWDLREDDALPYEIDGYGFIYIFQNGEDCAAYKKSETEKYKRQIGAIKKAVDKEFAKHGL